MGNLFVRGNTIWIFYSVDGKQYRKSLKLKDSKHNMKLARNKLADVEYIIENNGTPTKDDLTIQRVKTEDAFLYNKTLQEVFDNFIQTKNQSDKNKKMYQNAFNKMKEVLKVDIIVNDVSEFYYETYKKYLIDNLSYNTASTYINYMNIFFNYLIKSKIYTKENPFIRLKRRDKKYIRTIPDEHFSLILDYLKEHNINLYRFICFLKYTGFRLNEALQLTWEQIKFDENVISMINYKDNSKNEIFPMNIANGELKTLLSEFKQDTGKLFIKLNAEWIRQPFQHSIQKINENKSKEDNNWKEIPNYTLHDIRRTAISKWAKKLSPLELTKIARHKDVQTTLKYYINLDMNDIADKLNK